MNPTTRSLQKSKELWEKGNKYIPSGTQTASKAPDQFARGTYPLYHQSGQGSRVFDVDGNEYIDYPCSLGAIFLGHNYPEVVQAIQKQAEEGIIFSLLHPLEVEVAELLIEMIPCAEQIRFMKNGSDATSAAVRVARSYTKREKIASCGYHGWQDWYIIGSEKNGGIPKSLATCLFKFEYNKIESLQKIFEENSGEIAAVIMEPVITEEPRDYFLQQVKELTHRYGALLIFDEMVTGFRFGEGGAQDYFKVTPDLACFGKSVANGMPLSILTGKKEFMDELNSIFVSTTFGGETISLAAAAATITEMKQKNVVEHIWNMGALFKQGYNKITQELGVHSESVGFPPRQNLIFKDQEGKISKEMKTLFLQETIKRGVLLGNVVFFNYSHTKEDIQKTLDACKDALQIIKKGLAENNLAGLIEGELAAEVFRQKVQQ